MYRDKDKGQSAAPSLDLTPADCNPLMTQNTRTRTHTIHFPLFVHFSSMYLFLDAHTRKEIISVMTCVEIIIGVAFDERRLSFSSLELGLLFWGTS